MASPNGAERDVLDQPRVLAHIVPLNGIWRPGVGSGQSWPMRAAPGGTAAVARGLILKGGVVEGLYGEAQLGDTPWGASGSSCYGLWQFRKHESTGALTRQMLTYIPNTSGGTRTIWKLNSPQTAWTSQGIFTVTANTQAAQAGNRLFFVNGTDRKFWDGTRFGDVVQTKPSNPSQNADPEDYVANGALLAGKYYAVGYTFYSSTTGDETLISSVNLYWYFTGAGSPADNVLKVNFPAATPDARFDKIKIYRSHAMATAPLPGEANLYYEQTLTWNTAGLTDQSVGTVADSLLTVVAPTAGSTRDFSSMPLARGICYWDGRLWCWGMKDAQTTLAWSYRDSIIGFPGVGALKLDDLSGLPIKNAFPFLGRLYVFTDESAWEVSINPVFEAGVSELAPPYIAKRISGSYGAGCPGSVCEAWGRMYGWSARRLWVSDGYTWTILSETVGGILPYASANLVGFDNLVQLMYDSHPDRDWVVVPQLSIAVHRDGSIVSLSSAGALASSDWATPAQDENGMPWLVSESGGEGIFRSFTSGTLSTPILTNKAGTGVALTYSLNDIDPDPSIVDKDYKYIDICTGNLDGTLETYVAYEGDSLTLLQGTVTYPVSGGADYVVTRYQLPLRGPRHVMRVIMNVTQGTGTNRFVLIWLKVWWKPWGRGDRTTM